MSLLLSTSVYQIHGYHIYFNVNSSYDRHVIQPSCTKNDLSNVCDTIQIITLFLPSIIDPQTLRSVLVFQLVHAMLCLGHTGMLKVINLDEGDYRRFYTFLHSHNGGERMYMLRPRCEIVHFVKWTRKPNCPFRQTDKIFVYFVKWIKNLLTIS